MLLLGHSGIPLGTVWLLRKATNRLRSPSAKGRPGGQAAGNPSPVALPAMRMDYRLILLGSLLPDIIDKPLGMWLLRDSLSSGRALGHTLFFTGFLATLGILLYLSRHRLSLLCLSFGSLAHLLQDELWSAPRTLLWPLYGWSFERTDVSRFLDKLLYSLEMEPKLYISEAIGGLLLAAFFFSLIRQGRFRNFLRTGEAE